MAHDQDGPPIDISDDGTDVMPPGAVGGPVAPSPATDADGPPLDPEDNPVVAETRRIRADEVVANLPALPFGDHRVAPVAQPAVAGPPGVATPETSVEIPEACTQAVRVEDAQPVSLPFQSALEPARSGPTPEELDEIVWQSKVAIDPSDLPSAQLIVPPSARAPSARGSASKARGRKLGLLLLVAALFVGFGIAALAMSF